jgi:hypothetical protein
MKRFLGVALSLIMLSLAISTMAEEGDGLSISSKQLKITLSDDVKAADEKVEAIKNYKVLTRIQNEIQGHLGALPASAKVEVVITGFRLRSGASGFFGMSGSDEIDARVTVKDKKKQLAHFSLNADNGRSGKTQPPTRRLVRLVQEFGQKFGVMLNVSSGRMPMFPPGIPIYPR